MNYETRRALVLVAGGLSIGAGLGYILAQRRLEKKYRQIAEEEIASVVDTFKRRYKEGEYSTVESAAQLLSAPGFEEKIEGDEEDELYKNALDAMARYTGAELEAIAEVNKKDEYKVFAGADGDIPVRRKKEPHPPNPYKVIPVSELVMPEPHPSEPYIITVDQFMDDFNKNGDDYDKITVSYYEGDDTLADEREAIVPDVEGTVGQANLSRFGHASEDPNVVYVRNERLRVDFEVLREEDAYSHQVLGLDERFLEHQEKPRPRKMRDVRDSG